MKVLIIYFSQTGNTAQIARAIQDEVSSRGHKAYLREIGEVTPEKLDDFDLIYLGSACHDTDLVRPAKRLLGDTRESPTFKLAGFVTHATQMPEDGERGQDLYEKCLDLTLTISTRCGKIGPIMSPLF